MGVLEVVFQEDLDAASEIFQGRADDVHAHAAACEFVDMITGAEAAVEDQLSDLGVGALAEVRQAGGCQLADFFHMDALAVILVEDLEIAAFGGDLDADDAVGLG